MQLQQADCLIFVGSLIDDWSIDWWIIDNSLQTYDFKLFFFFRLVYGRSVCGLSIDDGFYIILIMKWKIATVIYERGTWDWITLLSLSISLSLSVTLFVCLCKFIFFRYFLLFFLLLSSFVSVVFCVLDCCALSFLLASTLLYCFFLYFFFFFFSNVVFLACFARLHYWFWYERGSWEIISKIGYI